MRLPKAATFLTADNQKFEETVIFVPFFAGRRENLKRHAKLVNELGYSCVLFENSLHPRWGLTRIPVSKNRQWGLKHLWADEIENLLERVEGPKIVFGFSGPAGCAIEAVSRRNSSDVKAIICDSGPFYYSRHCNSNRLLYDEKIENPFKRLAVNSLHIALWSSNNEKTLQHSLSLLPQDFPVLSIRPTEDILVPPWAIDAAFREHSHLDLEVLEVAHTGHLKGLKDCPDIYVPAVKKFLKKHSQKISVRRS